MRQSNGGGDECEESGDGELHRCCGWEVAVVGKGWCLDRCEKDLVERREIAIIYAVASTYTRYAG